MHSVEIRSARRIERVPDSSVIRAHRQIQVTAGFIEQQGHPDGNEACRDPRIVVVVIRHVHVDKAEPMELAQSFPCEVGGAGKPDIAAPVPIDEESTVIEPRLGHDDRRKCVRHQARGKPVSTADIVVASPIRNHLSIRNRAHGLWHKIPVACTHRIPLTRIHQDVSMSRQHVVQSAVPERFWHVVPIGEMHAAPEREIEPHVINGRVPLDAFGAKGEGDGYRRRVTQCGVDVDWRYLRRRCGNLMLQPRYPEAAPAITSSSASVSAAVTRRIRGRADTPVRQDSRTT